jgi:glycosyltransferase involved in cell wall biosynthesis
MSTPELTIIVPSFNQGRYLAGTLESILSQRANVQVVVVDGASTDGTVELLRDYAARHPCIEWISEPDRGPADAVNKGLTRAHGEIVGIQSSDDLYLTGAFVAALEAFAKHPEVGLLWGDAQAIDEGGTVFFSGNLPQHSWESVFATRLCIPQSSTFFRRALLKQTAGWNGAYHSCDIEFWLRLLFRTQALKVDCTLSQWRVHAAQRTQAARGLYRDYARIIRESHDVRTAPLRIRRYAHGSIHLMALDYPPVTSLWFERRHALAALALFPESLSYRRGRKFEQLLPVLGHGARRLFRGG